MWYSITLLMVVNAYFEQKLIRRAINYTSIIDLNTDVTLEAEQKCESELLELTHNSTYVTQLCFTKNVFYNVEMIVGENQTEQKVMEFYIDLTSPWTWYKSLDCRQCKNTPLRFDFDSTCHRFGTTIKSCTIDGFNKTHNSTKWDDVKMQGMIYSKDTLLSGTFQTDQISLLAYNSSNGMSVVDYLKAQIINDEPTTFVNITNLQMLQVNSMAYDTSILADGSIGLGFGYTETVNESAQRDSDFVEQIVKESTQLKLTRQQFAIYSMQRGEYYPDYVIQFGGLDYKYAHYHVQDIVWINRVENSGYYWMVQVDQIGFKDLNQPLISQDAYLAPEVKRGILTLSSQFLELPLDILIPLMKKIESMHSGTKCKLVDPLLEVLYCTNLIFPNHFSFFQLTLKFPTLDHLEEVNLSSYHLLLNNCTAHANGGNVQDCIFNIKVSKSGYIILGEPFMRQHYVIFENQPGNNVMRVGILPAAVNMYYPDNSSAADWPLYRAVLYVFIFGILLMCCVTNLKRGLKDLFRAIRYRRATVDDSDVSKLRVKQMDDEINNYMEDDMETRNEIEMNEQVKKQNEWDKSKDQFNFSEKFTQIVEDHSI